MLQTRLFVPTLKEAPQNAEVKSHRLLARAGLVKQTASGIYSYLPLGWRVMRKIEQIVREEHDKRGASELLMPALQPRDLWEESGRWSEYGPELMRLKDRKDRDFLLGPTHEEVITDIVRDYIDSYKRLPLALYQIQTKYRDELRPRFGLMRGREFVMKDLYTFSENEEGLDQWYQSISEAYTAIFNRVGLETRIVASDTGAIGGDVAHEFMVMSEVGEDTIAYCTECDYAGNQEFNNLSEGDACPVCGGTVKTAKGIEVGNIFKLGTKYSKSMNAYVTNKDGERVPMQMGCYGIGISRTLMAAVEQHSTENSILWPQSITPFDIHMIPINLKGEDQKTLETLYESLNGTYEVLVDDRDERAGVKFKDADLIGIPIRIVLGKALKEGKVELVDRRNDVKKTVPIEALNSELKTLI
ncbi:MAG: proline--tRNA ligase [Bacillota bacterium]